MSGNWMDSYLSQPAAGGSTGGFGAAPATSASGNDRYAAFGAMDNSGSFGGSGGFASNTSAFGGASAAPAPAPAAAGGNNSPSDPFSWKGTSADPFASSGGASGGFGAPSASFGAPASNGMSGFGAASAPAAASGAASGGDRYAAFGAPSSGGGFGASNTGSNSGFGASNGSGFGTSSGGFGGGADFNAGGFGGGGGGFGAPSSATSSPGLSASSGGFGAPAGNSFGAQAANSFGSSMGGGSPFSNTFGGNGSPAGDPLSAPSIVPSMPVAAAPAPTGATADPYAAFSSAAGGMGSRLSGFGAQASSAMQSGASAAQSGAQTGLASAQSGFASGMAQAQGGFASGMSQAQGGLASLQSQSATGLAAAQGKFAQAQESAQAGMANATAQGNAMVNKNLEQSMGLPAGSMGMLQSFGAPTPAQMAKNAARDAIPPELAARQAEVAERAAQAQAQAQAAQAQAEAKAAEMNAKARERMSTVDPFGGRAPGDALAGASASASNFGAGLRSGASDMFGKSPFGAPATGEAAPTVGDSPGTSRAATTGGESGWATSNANWGSAFPSSGASEAAPAWGASWDALPAAKPSGGADWAAGGFGATSSGFGAPAASSGFGGVTAGQAALGTLAVGGVAGVAVAATYGASNESRASTPGSSASGTNLGPSAPVADPFEERDPYQYELDAMFQEQSKGTGKVVGKQSIDFFKRFGVPMGTLKVVWDLAAGKAGHLERSNFFTALRLITLAQQGMPVTLEALQEAGFVPAPKYADGTVVPAAAAATAAAAAGSAAGSAAATAGALSVTAAGKMEDEGRVSDDDSEPPPTYGPGPPVVVAPVVDEANTRKWSATVREEVERTGTLVKHTEYKLVTLRPHEAAIEVVRRYSDFQWLHDTLSIMYPFRILPPLPPKKQSDDEKDLRRTEVFRRLGLERFIQSLLQRAIFYQKAEILELFCLQTDYKQFTKLKDNSAKTFNTMIESSFSARAASAKNYVQPNAEDYLDSVHKQVRATEVYLRNVMNQAEQLVVDHISVATSLTKLSESMSATRTTDLDCVQTGCLLCAKNTAILAMMSDTARSSAATAHQAHITAEALHVVTGIWDGAERCEAFKLLFEKSEKALKVHKANEKRLQGTEEKIDRMVKSNKREGLDKLQTQKVAEKRAFEQTLQESYFLRYSMQEEAAWHHAYQAANTEAFVRNFVRLQVEHARALTAIWTECYGKVEARVS